MLAETILQHDTEDYLTCIECTKWIELEWPLLLSLNSVSVFSAAVLYHRWGKLELAKKHYELSLKLDPEAPGTRDNYNMLRRKLDQLKRHTPWGSPLGPQPAVKQIVPLFHLVLFFFSQIPALAHLEIKTMICVSGSGFVLYKVGDS